MLTDNQMLEKAKQYILFMNPENEWTLIEEYISQKPYGNIYFYNHKELINNGKEKYGLAGNAPFLVEKKTGRVVIFGTAYETNYYIKAYENGALIPSLDRYWYPETETYSYK